jgi:uncharacterized protein YcbK (DUF882 family)
MHLPRRAFLRATGAAVLTLGAPALARATTAITPKGARGLKLHNLHTNETLAADYWIEGKYQPEVLAGFNRFLRDWRNNQEHQIDPRLFDLLHDIHAGLDAKDGFQVISGYRSPQTNGMLHEKSSGVASHSLHMEGMAMDVRVPGKALTMLHDCALRQGKGGVGFYPQSNFVHVDVGRVRRWNGA